MPARRPVAWGLLAVRRRGAPALIGCERAARCERTARWQLGERWNNAWDFLQPGGGGLAAHQREAGNGVDQAAGVRMARPREQRAYRGLLDLAAGVHHDYALRSLR